MVELIFELCDQRPHETTFNMRDSHTPPDVSDRQTKERFFSETFTNSIPSIIDVCETRREERILHDELRELLESRFFLISGRIFSASSVKPEKIRISQITFFFPHPGPSIIADGDESNKLGNPRVDVRWVERCS